METHPYVPDLWWPVYVHCDGIGLPEVLLDLSAYEESCKNISAEAEADTELLLFQMNLMQRLYEHRKWDRDTLP